MAQSTINEVFCCPHYGANRRKKCIQLQIYFSSTYNRDLGLANDFEMIKNIEKSRTFVDQPFIHKLRSKVLLD